MSPLRIFSISNRYPALILVVTPRAQSVHDVAHVVNVPIPAASAVTGKQENQPEYKLKVAAQ